MNNLNNIYSTKNAVIEAFNKFNSVDRTKLNEAQIRMLDNTINGLVLFASEKYGVTLF